MSDFNNVVVFGGAGYIGCITVELLLKQGFNVTVFDNMLFGSAGLDHLKTNTKLKIIEASICDTVAVSAAVKGAEAVILLAAIVGHRVKEVPATLMRTTNFLASTVVLDAAIEHGVSRFIFASTNSVYGAESGLFFETSMPSPVSLYARLKLRMEERIINAKKRASFHPLALRIGTCYGISPRMRFDLVVNSLIRDAIETGELTIESGEQMRAFIHVKDAANAIVLSLLAHENLISGEVFNLAANDQNLQINQVASIIKEMMPEISVKILPGEPDLASYKLSSKKIEKVLDFKPVLTIEDSLVEIRSAFEQGLYKDTQSPRYNNT